MKTPAQGKVLLVVPPRKVPAATPGLGSVQLLENAERSTSAILQ